MNHALYYPTIEFADAEALKKALLVWDRTFRIVPSGYMPLDPVPVQEAISAGRVTNLEVDLREKQKAAEGFLDFYAKRRSPGSPLVWPAGFESHGYARLNTQKIDAKLLPLFEQLAREVDEDFISVQGDLAAAYMFYLAKSVADTRTLAMTTDSPEIWAVGTYFANGGSFDEYVTADDRDAYLCNLAIEDLLPADLSGIPMEKVLEFSQSHGPERAAFQSELEALTKEISTCENKDHARYIVHDFVRRFETAKNEYQRTLAPWSKREQHAIVTVGIPATVGFWSLVQGAGGNPFDAISLATVSLIGAVSAFAARESVPITPSVASYLVSADRLASPRSEGLHRLFKEFLND